MLVFFYKDLHDLEPNTEREPHTYLQCILTSLFYRILYNVRIYLAWIGENVYLKRSLETEMFRAIPEICSNTL